MGESPRANIVLDVSQRLSTLPAVASHRAPER
jgi:hypothetical protein